MPTYSLLRNIFKAFWVLSITSVLFSSCNNSPFTSEQKSKVKALMGKELIFPSDLTLYSLTEKKEFSEIQFNSKKSFRMAAYIDASCGTCINELSKWDSIINNQNNRDLEYLLILKASDDFEFFKYVVSEVNYKNFNTVILDIGEVFYHTNNIPNDKQLQAYLLNDKNVIIGVGNPAVSEEVMNSYSKLIRD